jgi:tetratricopeptide (TPR) repeat protein
VALALEEQPRTERSAAELAWHLAKGDEPARALPYALQAGAQAETVYAHTEAEGHYRMAVRLARRLGDQAAEADALERLSPVLYNVGRIVDIPATLESAAALGKKIGDLDQYAWDTAYITRADISLGRAASGLDRLQALLTSLAAQADYDTAAGPRTAKRAFQPHQDESSITDLEAQAARAATLLSSRSSGRVYLSLTACLVHNERYEEAIPLGEHAVSYAQAAGEDWSQARAQRFLGCALEAIGQISRASAAFEAGGAVAERARDLEGIIHNYGALAGIDQRRGAFNHARSHLRFVMETAERFGVPEFILQAASGLAQTSYFIGDWGQARAYCARALETMHVSDVLTDSPWPMYVLGMLCLAQGDAQQARACLDEAIALSERAQNLPILRAAHAAPAECELLNGHAQAAYSRLASLLSSSSASDGQAVGAVDMIAVLPLLAWAHADLGDIGQEEAALIDAIARASTLEQYVVLVDTLRIQAMLAMRRGQWEEAQRALDEAFSRSHAMPYPYAEAKALYVYGRLHVAKGELGTARERFEQALAILHRLGERLYAEHVEQELETISRSPR